MSQSGISAHLLTAGVAIAAMVALTVTGWLAATAPVDSPQANVDGEILAIAFGLSQQAGAMVAAGSQPTAPSMTQESLERLSASISAQQAGLQQEVAMLEGRGYDQRTARIRRHVDALASNMTLIEQVRPGLLRLLSESQADHRRLNYQINKPLETALVTSLDGQLHRMVRGDDGTGDPTGGPPSPCR